MSSSSIDITTMASAVQSVSTVPQLIAMLQSATPTEAADILAILDRGLPLWTERREAADASSTHAAHVEGTPVKAKAAAAPSAPQKPKKAAAPKVAKEKPAPMALPEAVAGAPEASEYRLPADSWDADACIARITKGGEDKRWKPIIFRESACGGKVVEGSDLCAKCCKREEKYAADPKPGDWCGRLTEEPLDWQHMLGTAWADEKKPKFLGLSSSGASVADEVASENGSAEEMPAPAKAKPDAAAKEAAAAAKLAEKEAAKAAKAAKAAEKEAAKAAKLTAATAAKEEKAAAAAAAKAAKAAPKPKAEKAAAVKAVKAAPKAKAVAVAAAPVEVEGELKLIDGTLYMVKKGNVFEYDELTEVAGDFVGRLTADETIDTEAEEVTAVESDTD